MSPNRSSLAYSHQETLCRTSSHDTYLSHPAHSMQSLPYILCLPKKSYTASKGLFHHLPKVLSYLSYFNLGSRVLKKVILNLYFQLPIRIIFPYLIPNVSYVQNYDIHHILSLHLALPIRLLLAIRIEYI